MKTKFAFSILAILLGLSLASTGHAKRFKIICLNYTDYHVSYCTDKDECEGVTIHPPGKAVTIFYEADSIHDVKVWARLIRMGAGYARHVKDVYFEPKFTYGGPGGGAPLEHTFVVR